MAYIDDRAVDIATQYGMFMNAQGGEPRSPVPKIMSRTAQTEYRPVVPITRTAQTEYRPVVPITRIGRPSPLIIPRDRTSSPIIPGRPIFGFDGSNGEFMMDNNGSPSDLWFNQSGSNTITVGGDKYSFEPVLSWNAGCDSMDDSGDGIFPNQNCQSKPGVGGVPGLGVSALRWKNGVMY